MTQGPEQLSVTKGGKEIMFFDERDTLLADIEKAVWK